MRGLSISSISIRNSTWKDFQANWSSDNVLVDLIVIESPYKPCPIVSHTRWKDEIQPGDELEAHVQQAMGILLPGGYILISTNVFTCVDWFWKLGKNGFQVMQYLGYYINERN